MRFSTVTHRSYGKEAGQVLVLGQGDVGQLGHGEDVLQRKKPSLVSLPEKTVQVVAGGMHTVCLSESGHVRDGVALSLFICGFLQNKLPCFLILQVYTFGCNDEGALGRETTEEGSEMVPGKVLLEEKVVQVSAGDSHTAALTDDGTVFIWGAFRVSHTSMFNTLLT